MIPSNSSTGVILLQIDTTIAEKCLAQSVSLSCSVSKLIVRFIPVRSVECLCCVSQHSAGTRRGYLWRQCIALHSRLLGESTYDAFLAYISYCFLRITGSDDWNLLPGIWNELFAFSWNVTLLHFLPLCTHIRLCAFTQTHRGFSVQQIAYTHVSKYLLKSSLITK